MTTKPFELPVRVYCEDADAQGSTAAAHLTGDTMKPKRIPSTFFEEDPS
ncbi:MAG: hypothetical protein OSA87_02475 [Woeseiaceae bacterium]|nr:hypothetical protein [Woeseiaceae bacterium]